jgi:hypothetical protein
VEKLRKFLFSSDGAVVPFTEFVGDFYRGLVRQTSKRTSAASARRPSLFCIDFGGLLAQNQLEIGPLAGAYPVIAV